MDSQASTPSSMDNDDETHYCKKCGLILEEGRAYELGGNRWHVECFRCSSCSSQLDCDTNLLVLGNGSLICNNCSYHCHVCNKKIEDLAILTGDQAFCSSCFCCRNCKKRIEDLRYARTSQGIFCMSCHEKLLSRRKKSSSLKSDGSIRSKSGNSSFLPLQQQLDPNISTPSPLNGAASRSSQNGFQVLSSSVSTNSFSGSSTYSPTSSDLSHNFASRRYYHSNSSFKDKLLPSLPAEASSDSSSSPSLSIASSNSIPQTSPPFPSSRAALGSLNSQSRSYSGKSLASTSSDVSTSSSDLASLKNKDNTMTAPSSSSSPSYSPIVGIENSSTNGNNDSSSTLFSFGKELTSNTAFSASSSADTSTLTEIKPADLSTLTISDVKSDSTSNKTLSTLNNRKNQEIGYTLDPAVNLIKTHNNSSLSLQQPSNYDKSNNDIFDSFLNRSQSLTSRRRQVRKNLPDSSKLSTIRPDRALMISPTGKKTLSDNTDFTDGSAREIETPYKSSVADDETSSDDNCSEAVITPRTPPTEIVAKSNSSTPMTAVPSDNISDSVASGPPVLPYILCANTSESNFRIKNSSSPTVHGPSARKSMLLQDIPVNFNNLSSSRAAIYLDNSPSSSAFSFQTVERSAARNSNTSNDVKDSTEAESYYSAASTSPSSADGKYFRLNDIAGTNPNVRSDWSGISTGDDHTITPEKLERLIPERSLLRANSPVSLVLDSAKSLDSFKAMDSAKSDPTPISSYTDAQETDATNVVATAIPSSPMSKLFGRKEAKSPHHLRSPLPQLSPRTPRKTKSFLLGSPGSDSIRNSNLISSPISISSRKTGNTSADLDLGHHISLPVLQSSTALSLAEDLTPFLINGISPSASSTYSSPARGHRRSISDNKGMSARTSSGSSNFTSPLGFTKGLEESKNLRIGENNPSGYLTKELVRSKKQIAELERQLLDQRESTDGTKIVKLDEGIEEKRKTIAGLEAHSEVAKHELKLLEQARSQTVGLKESSKELVEEFTLELTRVKESLQAEIAELVIQRDKLVQETMELDGVRERAIEESSILNIKNTQLADMNNELTRQILEKFSPYGNGNTFKPNYNPKQHHTTNSASSGPYKLGTNGDIGMVSSSESLGAASTLGTGHGQEDPIVTILDAGEVVDNRKDRQYARRFWKRPGAAVAKGAVKGFNRVFANENSTDSHTTTTPDLLGSVYSPPMFSSNGGAGGLNIVFPNGKEQITSSSSSNAISNKSSKTRNGWFKASSDMKAAEPALMGVPIERRVAVEGTRVPLIVTRCIQEVESRGMLFEGVYRKSGGRSQISFIEEAFEKSFENSPAFDEVLSGDISGVTSALKQYLRFLPDPLITYDAYDEFIQCTDELDQAKNVDKMRQVVNSLPTAHRDCLEYVVRHLGKVTEFSDKNLMTSRNLAVVFAPTLARHMTGEREIIDMQARNDGTQLLIDHFATIFSDI